MWGLGRDPIELRHPFLEVLRALGAERVLEQVLAREELELVVLDGGAEEDEEGVEERERPQPPDDHLEVEVVVRW